MRVRVLLADDHSAIRRLLRRLIEAHQGWMVSGEAGGGHDDDAWQERLSGVQIRYPAIIPDLALLLVTVHELPSETHLGVRGSPFENDRCEAGHAVETLV